MSADFEQDYKIVRGMFSLKTGISGVRGIVGESLTPGLLVRFAQAFGTYLRGGQVAIGSDTRTSAEMVRSALIGGLLATGCDVHDYGVMPVPTLQIVAARRDYEGGIAITASHNPQEWNALKFIRWDGVFLYPYQAEELLNVYHQGEFSLVGEEAVGCVRQGEGALETHLEMLLAAADVEAIRSAGLRVVLDCCNGAGAMLAPTLLHELGCKEVIVINGEPNGLFPHRPEPVPENLSQLEEAVRETGADIGFAQDADADRLALVSEKGRA
ncbi:MAG: phosphoglucosamine mutase, partial [Armatimonadetes bacterium]|nr:phosphoglucosamine mutase [Armatimonadota bacterium]